MRKNRSPVISKFETVRNGLHIRGKVYGECLKMKPAVILSHGFMANQSMCKKYACMLADLGYICFTFDFCGGSIINSSDGTTTEMTIFTEVADLEAVVEYVRKLPYVDIDHISLLGCSQGGVVSAIVAKNKPNEIDKLILFYPALCIPDDARKGKMVFAKFDPDNIPEKMWCGPMRIGRDYAASVKELNIFKLIGGFQNSVLLLHGSNDKIVSITYSRQAKELYDNIEFHEIIGGGHGFKGIYDKQAMDFLKEFMDHVV